MSDTIQYDGQSGFERVQRRLDELERENRRLAAQVEELSGSPAAPQRAHRGPAPRTDDVDVVAVEDGSLGRRSMLKRFGQVAAAGVGMAAVGGALRPEPALASHEGVVELGHTNTAAQGEKTTIEMFTVDPENEDVMALEVRNNGLGGAIIASSDWGVAATLQLTPGSDVPTIGRAGSLGTNTSGGITDLYFFHTRGEEKDGSDSEVGKVYTSQFANFLSYLAEPVRVLDTRDDAKHPHGSAGKLQGQFTIDISSEIPSNTIAVYGTLAAIQPDAPGFLTLWPDGSWPGTTNINYPTGLTLATLTTTRVTSGGTFELRVDGLAHVTFDVVAVVVPS